nr:hypothetical protein [Tanacetum cinerariifolium]
TSYADEEEDMQTEDITHETEEETLSLDAIEKEMILKALRKHHNKRKYAAQDLGISERTLYRGYREPGRGQPPHHSGAVALCEYQGFQAGFRANIPKPGRFSLDPGHRGRKQRPEFRAQYHAQYYQRHVQ